jgi:hypothetical protein
VAEALRSEGKLAEAIDVWKSLLVRTRAKRRAGDTESNTLQSLVPALIEAGRKVEATPVLEEYFFSPAPTRPPLGYAISSQERNWLKLGYGNDGREELRAVTIMRLAQEAGAMERLRARAVAAAAASQPQDPDRLLVLLIDSLSREPARLDALRKGLDEAIATAPQMESTDGFRRFMDSIGLGVANLSVPWNPMTSAMLRSIAQVLSEWPEARPLALHVFEKTPEFGAGSPGWVKLHRAEIALSIPDKDAASRALREWLTVTGRTLSGLITTDPAQQLSAVDLMIRAGMTSEASALLKKMHSAGEIQNRPDLKKRVEDLVKRLTGAGSV